VDIIHSKGGEPLEADGDSREARKIDRAVFELSVVVVHGNKAVEESGGSDDVSSGEPGSHQLLHFFVFSD
jgi:hypothetical protein